MATDDDDDDDDFFFGEWIAEVSWMFKSAHHCEW